MSFEQDTESIDTDDLRHGIEASLYMRGLQTIQRMNDSIANIAPILTDDVEYDDVKIGEVLAVHYSIDTSVFRSSRDDEPSRRMGLTAQALFAVVDRDQKELQHEPVVVRVHDREMRNHLDLRAEWSREPSREELVAIGSLLISHTTKPLDPAVHIALAQYGDNFQFLADNFPAQTKESESEALIAELLDAFIELKRAEATDDVFEEAYSSADGNYLFRVLFMANEIADTGLHVHIIDRIRDLRSIMVYVPGQPDRGHRFSDDEYGEALKTFLVAKRKKQISEEMFDSVLQDTDDPDIFIG